MNSTDYTPQDVRKGIPGLPDTRRVPLAELAASATGRTTPVVAQFNATI